MKPSYEKRGSGTWNSWEFKVGKVVLSAVAFREHGDYTLTMTIGRWSFGGFCASTATASSDPAGTRPR
jgi:hypothetical protein